MTTFGGSSSPPETFWTYLLYIRSCTVNMLVNDLQGQEFHFISMETLQVMMLVGTASWYMT